MTDALENMPAIRGHAGLILPEYSNVFDSTQQKPITDTWNWVDTTFRANMYALISSNPNAIFMPPTRQLGIIALQRGGNDDYGVGYEDFASIFSLTIPSKAGPDLDSVFGMVRSFNLDGPNVDVIIDKEEEVYVDDTQNEIMARGVLQPLIRSLLQDLGYGEPDKFSQRAITLRECKDQTVRERFSN